MRFYSLPIIKMIIELKKAIIDYIIENKDIWNRLNHTTTHFYEYIFDKNGEFLIGGEEIYNRIKKANELF